MEEIITCVQNVAAFALRGVSKKRKADESDLADNAGSVPTSRRPVKTHFCKVCRAAKSKNIFSNEGASVYTFVV